MKLPKKYAGITPGEWKFWQGRIEDDFMIVEPTGNTLAEPNHPLFMDYSDLDPSIRNIGLDEAKQNAVLMADSPRLAAAVVELREALQKAISILDDKVDYRPDDEDGGEYQEVKNALASTEEWRE